MIRHIIFFALTAIISMAAFAAGKGMGPGMGAGTGMGAGAAPHYRNLDTNGDGYISRQEIQAHQRRVETLSQNWEQADRNQDGRVDRSEFSAFEERELGGQQQMQEEESIEWRINE